MVGQLNARDESIPILPDWDSFPEPWFDLSHPSFYVGRDDQSDQLIYWITKSSGGSVLVSGVRGVGKTAFVYECIRRSYLKSFTLGSIERRSESVRKWLIKKGSFFRLVERLFQPISITLNSLVINLGQVNPITVVPINATSIDPKRFFIFSSDTDRKIMQDHYSESNEIFYKYAMLQSLISSLHFSNVRDKSLRKKIERLYYWSISEGTNSGQRSKGWYFNLLGKVNVTGLVSLILIIFLGILLYIFKHLQMSFPLEYILEIILPLILVVGFVAINYSAETHVKTAVNSRNFDYLVSQLNEVLNKTSKEIFVFVIDELDKRENEDIKIGADESNFLDFFASNFKNLITITGGRFIFITSEKYALSAMNNYQLKRYPARSTFFNWRIFLAPAGFEHIRSFLNKITIGSDREELDLLAYYLYSESSGVFGKVKQLIHDYIVYFADKNIILRILGREQPYLRIDRLGDTERQIARVGKIMNLVCKQRPVVGLERQGYAYVRQQLLHEITDELIKQSAGAVFNTLGWTEQENYIELLNGLDYLDKEALKNEVVDYLKELSRLSGYDEKLRTSKDVLGWTDDQGRLRSEIGGLTLSSLYPGFQGIPEELTKGLSTAELNLVNRYESIRLLLSEWAKLVNDHSIVSQRDVLDIIDPTLGQEYSQIAEVVERVKLLGESQSNDQREIYFDSKLIQSFISKLESSLSPDAMGEKFVWFIARNLVKEFGIETKTTMSEKYAVIEYGDKKCMILQKEEDIRFQKSEISPQFNIVNDYNGLKSIDDFVKLRVDIMNALDLERFTLNPRDWNPPEKDKENKTANQRYTSLSIPQQGNFVIEKFKAVVECKSEYWRFGLGLGADIANVDPLSEGNYTLWHLFKEEGNSKLYFRRIPNKKKPTYHDYRSEIEAVPASENIAFEARIRDMYTVDFFVNDLSKPVDTFKIPSNDAKRLVMLAWADGREYAMAVKDIEVTYAVLPGVNIKLDKKSNKSKKKTRKNTSHQLSSNKNSRKT